MRAPPKEEGRGKGEGERKKKRGKYIGKSSPSHCESYAANWFILDAV